jgi:hypothetical protein
MTTVKAMAMLFSGGRPVVGSAAIRVMMTAVKTTVMGPVGSEIRVGVPPKRSAKSPTSTAP